MSTSLVSYIGRMSALLWFLSGNHCSLGYYLWYESCKHFHQTMVYAASFHTDLDSF